MRSVIAKEWLHLLISIVSSTVVTYFYYTNWLNVESAKLDMYPLMHRAFQWEQYLFIAGFILLITHSFGMLLRLTMWSIKIIFHEGDFNANN